MSTPTPPPPREGQRHTQEPYTLTDNSGGFTGTGWRVSGPAGFDVYADRQKPMAEEVCRQMNRAHAAALRGLASPATDVPRLIAGLRTLAAGLQYGTVSESSADELRQIALAALPPEVRP